MSRNRRRETYAPLERGQVTTRLIARRSRDSRAYLTTLTVLLLTTIVTTGCMLTVLLLGAETTSVPQAPGQVSEVRNS